MLARLGLVGGRSEASNELLKKTDAFPHHTKTVFSGSDVEQGVNPASNVEWECVTAGEEPIRRTLVPSETVSMIASPHTSWIRALKEVTDYGVGCGRAAGHWVGRHAGTTVGTVIGGVIGLIKQCGDCNTHESLGDRVETVADSAARGGLHGGNTGDWLGGVVGNALANVFTLGSPAVIAYVDRSLNGES